MKKVNCTYYTNTIKVKVTATKGPTSNLEDQDLPRQGVKNEQR